VVFPLVFGFLSTAAPEGVTVATDIALYLDFVIKMFFAFGLAFEVPIVVVLLIITGMTTPEKLSHARPYIVVAAFVLGMLLTPPDIISQTLLAIPVWLLYEAGVIVGGMVLKARGKNKDEDEDETEATSDQNEAANKRTKSSETTTEPEFDDRYADQLDEDWDDSDWDDTFDQIEAEFDALEKNQSKQRKNDAGPSDDDEPPKK
jgi:sec-independent protein translocase protein TatC